MSKSGKLVRNSKGQFVKGASANPNGRPVGSKNKVTQMKVALEDAFRSDNFDDIQRVLRLVLKQALQGDKSSQKLIWDASVSKANIQDDKSAGSKQQITIHRMEVAKEGDIIDMKPEEDNEQREQTASDGPVQAH